MDDSEVAIALVRAGAAVVRRRFNTPLERIAKGGGDFATIADIEAEREMLAVVRAERPGDAVLGEESGRTAGAGSSRTWLIDPLCGTRNYVAGMRAVAVNAALSSPGGMLAAAVADPFAQEVFWTDGRTAFRRRDGADERLVPSPSSRLVDLNLDPPFPNAAVFRAVSLAAEPEFVAGFIPRVISSSLALAWVATGQRAAYVTDGDVSHSVHFAAGVALCAAAGCVASDLEGGSVRIGARGLVVAADRPTHAELLRLAQRQRG